MLNHLAPSFYGWILILTVFAYTVYLIGVNKLSVHMAINWILAELAFMLLMYFDGLRSHIRIVMGEERAAYSLLLIGAIWFIFLMLETLSRISAQAAKLKNLNQELALTRERLERVESQLQRLQAEAKS